MRIANIDLHCVLVAETKRELERICSLTYMHCHRLSTFHPQQDRGRIQNSRDDSFRNSNTYNNNGGDSKRVKRGDRGSNCSSN